MARHHQVAADIRRLIRARKLRPGDPLPSERELAVALRVAYSTVRLANDELCRDGIIHRAHGRGTFLAPRQRAPRRLRHRLGLFYVDPRNSATAYSQRLTSGIQRAANLAGFELLIGEFSSTDLVQGRTPEMLRRRSVDAVLLDGAIREHHLRFLEDQGVLYVVTGTCPLPLDVPQFRLDGERLGFEITRELLKNGRSPVWLDVDLSRTERYHMGLELFRGYSSAIQRYGDGRHALHLCSLHADQIAGAAARLAQVGLKNAAIISQDWGATLLPAALELKSSTPRDLLIVPLPTAFTRQEFVEANAVQWSQFLEAEEIGRRAVCALVDVLEGRSPSLRTVSIETRCALVPIPPTARMELKCEWKPVDAFAMERHGHGGYWRRLEKEEGGRDALSEVKDRRNEKVLATRADS
ncbi:MAG: GntR family transcriptional regulator [Verrucomicrobiae bacterium]|nr:GntR family transcriptional regulator [Verrucomicrobiae bacterium]